MLLANRGQDVNGPHVWMSLEQKVTKPTYREVLNIKETERAANPGAVWDTTAFRRALKLVITKEKAVREVFASERQEPTNSNKGNKGGNKKKKGKDVDAQPTLSASAVKSSGAKSDSSKRSSTSSKPNSGKTSPKCILCSQSHWSSDCTKYRDYDSRMERVRSEKLCYKCLKSGHASKECKTKLRACFYCKGTNHNRVLCRKQFGPPEVSQKSDSTLGMTLGDSLDHEDIVTSGLTSSERAEMRTLFLCAEVEAFNPSNQKKKVTVTVFFDCGSEKTYVSKQLMQKLKLKTLEMQSFNLSGIEGRDLGQYAGALTSLGVRSGEFSLIFEANEAEKIIKPLYKTSINSSIVKELRTQKVSLPWEVAEPSILIGIDQFNMFKITPFKQLKSGFWLSNSTVGLMLNGRGYNAGTTSHIQNESSVSLSARTNINNGLDESELTHLVRQSFDAERIGMVDPVDLDEEEFWLNEFTKQVKFNGERYQVGLPWNQHKHELPSNYGFALGHLKTTLRRLRERPELLKIYHLTIMDQLNQGMIERAPKVADGIVHYLPHQAVIREDKSTTKLRVVNDGSATVSVDSVSLNDCLHKGPVLLNDLAGVIMRTRLYPILLVSDIEKAFLMIEIIPSDRDAVRFLWVEDPFVIDSPLVTYRFTRVAFGLVSSPAQLATTLKYHLDRAGSELAKAISRDLYVDNVLVGLKNKREVSLTYYEQKKLFKSAGMNIREFASNERSEILKLPKKDQGAVDKTKVLGITWLLEDDKFVITLPKFGTDEKVTRDGLN